MAEQVFMATNATRTIAATTTPMRALLPGVARHARVYNAAPVIAYIRFGLNDMDASVSTSMPLGPGAVEVFRVPATAGYVSVVLASGTGTVYVTPGEGS